MNKKKIKKMFENNIDLNISFNQIRSSIDFPKEYKKSDKKQNKLAFLIGGLLTIASLIVLSILAFLKEETVSTRYSIFINEYNSYQELREDIIKLNNNYPENEQFIFEPDVNLICTYHYFIGGICYCDKEHLNDKCPNLHNREVFIELHFQDDSIVTIIYKDLTNSFYNDVYFDNNNGGNCYRYEKNYDENEQYILFDENDYKLLGIKFLYTNEEDKKLIFERIKEIVLEVKPMGN